MVSVGVALVSVLAVVGVASASHQWNKYHWARSSNSELILSIGDCHTPSSVGINWSSLLTYVVGNWNSIPDEGGPYNSPYIGFSKDACGRGNYVQSFNDNYGDTGWLGLASISIYVGKDKHIASGRTQVNEYYVTLVGYDGFDEDVEWKHVLCQEAGHTFGLDHNNNGTAGGSPDDTCMNTDQRPLRYPTPNVHDWEMFNSTTMYNHVHSGGGPGGGGPPGPGGGPPGGGPPGSPGTDTVARAFWAEHYATRTAVGDAADAIVVARVVTSSRGPGLGRVIVPTTHVRLDVEEIVKGDERLSRGLLLQQTGAAGEFFIEDDPAYQPGERYALYLRQIPNGLYRTVGPQGRIRL